ncbi:ABC transporter ATP-binding protein [Nonomuraea cavernae]|uniref:ABC transporter ATP-binding protein n=1 Tax=Nonomuraea cavernae TaxID=2045107 RepID=A0A918DHB2_9ACTN|nr:ABC transporter ATP-binding protein [Nonomuraea cavernae]MCA2185354.1 ABC transporter ATP-binding protein [Nonomuraea cavernae]GGO66215.1 ABC transporter ATP-binding protein [Nonomuraea cavernae]
MNPTLSELEAQASVERAAFGGDAHIVCDNLVRIYKTEGVEVVALQGLDLLIQRGELVAIVGASGSGKSTLLNVLSGLDVPTAGVARVAGMDLLAMTAKDRLRYRREVVGFIWQQTARNLLPYLTARENVELPMKLAGKARRGRALELLDLLGVGHSAGHGPAELSGGEQQRVAIAVALANSPQLILADEPTGELDSETSAQVFDALRKANRELGVTVVIVTHDPLVSEQVDRTIGIRDGRTSSETLRREDAEGRLVAEEYAVLDRVGRLQLPRDFMNALEMERRVRLELESDHIGVWPAREEPSHEQ